MRVQLSQIHRCDLRARPLHRWQVFLYDRHYLNDTDFLEHFRVRRDAFRQILAMIKIDDVFQVASHRTFRGPVQLHLVVLLKYLGSSEKENTSKYNLFFGFGKTPITT